ncbi:tRNA (adenosine(37)-N6)-dimethylallyltransferase MiaA [bacterium]|nr:tRNA (adenosine(37)-N6)-dimethylallyltransferase MiaA [bacterium]
MNNKITVVAVLGPTASGKTELSVELAKAFNGEIVSADSMQIYKGMDIATAKPTAEEMKGVPHHLIGFLDKTEKFSVARYVELAKKAVSDISTRGRLPFIVGGTGLYADSLLNNIAFTDNSTDSAVREKYQNLLRENGIEYLLNILKEVDSESYNRLCKEINSKRIIRALEFYEVTGKTITEQIRESKKLSPYNSVKIGLTCRDREKLYDRINRRVDIMVENGLVKEAEEFFSSKSSETAVMAIGYKELLPYFNNEATLDECLEKLKMNTRRYAKRQLTWFRRDQDINWIYIDECENFGELFSKAVNIIESKGIKNG